VPKPKPRFTKAHKEAVWERDGGICQKCLESVESWASAEFHHVNPLADGGLNTVENGLLLHTVCHTRYFEELHGYKSTTIRANMSKAAMKHWIYRRRQKPKDNA